MPVCPSLVFVETSKVLGIFLLHIMLDHSTFDELVVAQGCRFRRAIGTSPIHSDPDPEDLASN